jgi:hypothetical protein
MTGLLAGAKLVEIAEYIPASIKAVNTISAILFMGEFSEAQISCAAKYMPSLPVDDDFGIIFCRRSCMRTTGVQTEAGTIQPQVLSELRFCVL